MTVLQASRKWNVAPSTVDSWIRNNRIIAKVVLGHYDIPEKTKCPEKLRAGRKVGCNG